MSAPNPARKTLHLTVRGRVQGVFFRDSMRREARALGVAGWVQNCADGSVEAVVDGDASAVDAIVQWAHHGPGRAAVENVDVEPAEGGYAVFEILR